MGVGLRVGLLVALASIARGYTPALPVNDTTTLQRSSDVIQITWEPSGVFRTELSRQLIADAASYGNETYIPPSQDTIARGVLVHFSEVQTPQPGTKVPWIAFVTCDTNGTSFSDTDDIFSLARDRGAVAALLYSFTSEGCQINQDYLQNFQKPLDVYATTSKQGSRLIDSQFSNVGSMAYSYNSLTLNQSANSISALLNSSTFVVTNPAGGNATLSISSLTEAAVGTTVANLTFIRSSTVSTSFGSRSTSTSFDSSSANSSSTLSSSLIIPSTAPVSSFASTFTPTPTSSTPISTRLERRHATPTLVARQASSTIGAAFLLAVMASANSTFGTTTTNTTAPGSGVTQGQNGPPTTGLAMIVLYSITGLVSVMFLVVILSGAIRAIRHPERYGPRAGRSRRHREGGIHSGDSSDDEDERRDGGQSRTRGLTRAILDTFPVVKFGRGTEERIKKEDLERRKEFELERIEFGAAVRSVGEEERKRCAGAGAGDGAETREGTKLGSTDAPPTITDLILPSPPSPSSPTTSSAVPVVPPLTSTSDDSPTTCPICVEVFEPDDDIRVLPCDGRHAFHRDCIDPWLLEVSSLCPLCRLDLSTSKQSHEVSDAVLPSPSTSPTTTTGNGGRRRVSRGASSEEERGSGADEQLIIANLRGMLERGRSSSNAGSPTTLRTSGAGSGGVGLGESGLMRNRFFRYVASKRNARASSPSPTPIMHSTNIAPSLPPLPEFLLTPLSNPPNRIPTSTSSDPLGATTDEQSHTVRDR